MQLVSISSVRPNMVLANNIFDDRGCILLVRGTKLTEQYIRRLEEYGITSVYIDNDNAHAVEIEDLVSEEIRVQTVRLVRDTFTKIQTGNTVENDKIRKTVSEVVKEILKNKEVLIHLAEIRSVKDHTFNHSVSVCALSIKCGLSIGYNHERLKELGTGALLHDIGKSLLPRNIVTETAQFSQEELIVMRQHPELGYKIIKKSPGIGQVPADIALQHHERIDGAGYPQGLRGKNIIQQARIVAIADVYDALSTDRPYRDRLEPYHVVEIIESGRGSQFDDEIAAEFIRNIALFPKGSVVTLNTGAKGVVIDIKRSFPTRPTVRLLYDENGKQLENVVEVDLTKELTLFVVDNVR